MYLTMHQQNDMERTKTKCARENKIKQQESNKTVSYGMVVTAGAATGAFLHEHRHLRQPPAIEITYGLKQYSS
jgi:hypothetical protein